MELERPSFHHAGRVERGETDSKVLRALTDQRPQERTAPVLRPVRPLRPLLVGVWLGFLLALTLVLLAGAELGLHVRRDWIAAHLPLPENTDDRFVPDRALGYKNRPSYTYQSTSRLGALVNYSNNALGLRGPETTRAKPTGVRRVVILGGSTVYGALVDDPDTIAMQLQAVLRQRLGPDVEVLNGGVPSYDGLHEVVFARADLLALEPDAIVDVDGLNDVFFGTLEEWPSQVASGEIGMISDGRFGDVVSMIDRTMFPHGLLEHQLTMLWRDTRFRAYRLAHQGRPAAPRVISDRVVALHAGSMGLLAEYGRGHHAAVIAALQPLVAVGHKALTTDEQDAVRHEGYWSAGGWQEIAGDMYRRMAPTTRAAVEARGGLFVDTSDAFDDEPGTAYAEDAVHYTALGNKRLAATLAPLVVAGLQATARSESGP